MSDEAALLVALEQATNVTGEKWKHIASLPAELQRLALANYASQDWADPATPAGQRFLEIVSALGAVGSAVGAVAGAVAGVKTI